MGKLISVNILKVFSPHIRKPFMTSPDAELRQWAEWFTVVKSVTSSITAIILAETETATLVRMTKPKNG